jgi:acid phosphatase family membrane protein YuiD
MFNPYIVVPFLTWAIAQFLKFSLAALRGDVNFKYLYGSGGMPSVHSAVVISLATTSLLVDGPHSSIFGLTVIFAGIVMYDSFGVRRSSGEQAIAINHILENLEQRGSLSQPQHHLRELLGHKPLEVSVGAVLGLVLGLLFNIDRIGKLLKTLSSPMPLWLFWTLVIASAVLVIGSLVSRFVMLRKFGQIPQMRAAVSRSLALSQFFGWLGLIVAGLHYEKVKIAGWLVWPILLAIVYFPAMAFLVWRNSRELPSVLENYRVSRDKQKWFEGPNKERRKKRERAKKRK